jgi:hypothetical protein
MKTENENQNGMTISPRRIKKRKKEEKMRRGKVGWEKRKEKKRNRKE